MHAPISGAARGTHLWLQRRTATRHLVGTVRRPRPGACIRSVCRLLSKRPLSRKRCHRRLAVLNLATSVSISHRSTVTLVLMTRLLLLFVTAFPRATRFVLGFFTRCGLTLSRTSLPTSCFLLDKKMQKSRSTAELHKKSSSARGRVGKGQRRYAARDSVQDTLSRFLRDGIASCFSGKRCKPARGKRGAE